MIGVILTFRCGDNFNERAVRTIAETASPQFVLKGGTCATGYGHRARR
jgi:hypothetical protein